MVPTTVWVVVQLDREGNPRGFEKSTGRFFLEKASAEREAICMGVNAGVERVECVIMDAQTYRDLAEDSMNLKQFSA